jgi:hypothetical protein
MEENQLPNMQNQHIYVLTYSSHILQRLINENFNLNIFHKVLTNKSHVIFELQKWKY